MNFRFGATWSLIALAVLPALPHDSRAQSSTYPDRPIRVVVASTPGGATDGAARLLAARLSAEFGQPVVIDNRPGAGGTVGTAAAAQATPDGYTLLMGATTSMSIAPYLYRKLPYDPRRDFVPVALVGRVPQVLVVNPSVPATDLQALIALVKKGGGSIDYATFATGSSAHLTVELLKKAAQLEMTHVPYKGSGAALTGLIGGQVPIAMDTLQSVQPLVRSGKLRAIATSAEQRTSLAPELPTFAELGYPALTLSPWYGVFAPAGTPDYIVERLAAAVLRAMGASDMREKLANLGAEPMLLTGPAAHAFLDREAGRWAEAARISGAQLD
jgi:tripartite-type tricarboxylate transporter receptor subunit TctC